MSNELRSLNERIADRIGKDLVDLIPDDQWQGMVDKEIDKFNNITGPKIISDLLTEAYMNKAKATIYNLTQYVEWDSNAQKSINKELEKFIGESSGIIVASMLSPSMQMVLSDLQTRLNISQY